MTQAQQIAKRFGDNGQCWVNDLGDDLEDVLVREGAEAQHDMHHGSTRYQLADGSCIVVAGGAWDVGYSLPYTCHCWTGAGHDGECEQKCYTCGSHSTSDPCEHCGADKCGTLPLDMHDCEEMEHETC